MRVRRSVTVAAGAGLVIASALLAGGSATAQTPTSDLKIGMVTDVGGIDDKGFNEYSFAGTVAAAEAIGAAEPTPLISTQSADIGPNIQALVDQQYDVIVTVGFAAGEHTINAAREHPGIKFVAVDQAPCLTPEGEPDPDFKCEGDASVLLPNVQGINWREQQPGYLAGIVAASISKTGHIAAVGGTEVIPAVPNYIIGYMNGAKSINPTAMVSVAYASGAADNAAFFDPALGQSIAQQMLAQDPEIDVFFPVAGKTGNGVLDAACAANIWGIGVDVDQYLSKPDTASCTVVSAEKKLTKNVSDAIQRIGSGTDQGGILRLDLSTDDVGLSPFHEHEGLITAETQAAIDDATARMKAGTLEACVPQEISGFCVNPPPES